jgi:flagellar biogenesis protein FliO
MELLQQITAVAFVLLLAGAVAWTLRKGKGGLPTISWFRTGASRSSRELQLVERLPLTAQHCLHLVRVGQSTYLVATHPAGTALVSPAEPVTFSATFARAVTEPAGAPSGTPSELR